MSRVVSPVVSPGLDALRAEWGKLWSVRSPLGCLVGSALLTLLTATSLANDFVVDVRRGAVPAGSRMPVLDALTPAVQLGLALIAAFALLPITAEFGTGSIRSTLWAEPVRARVLHAKVWVAVAAAVPVGLLTAGLGWVVTDVVLGHDGVPAAGLGDTTAALLRVGLVCGLGAVLAVGVGAVLRSAIGTLAACFVLLVGLGLLPQRTAAWTPAGAVAEFVSGGHAVYPPVTGMLVLLGWAAAAYGLGWWMFERRDA